MKIQVLPRSQIMTGGLNLIVASAFADGGEEYFKLNDFSTGTTPFCIYGGSMNHSVYVQGASGNVGFKTNNPLKKLHIYHNNAPYIRLAQVGASGNQSWDIEANETWF